MSAHQRDKMQEQWTNQKRLKIELGEASILQWSDVMMG